jgi:hypothetical protein
VVPFLGELHFTIISPIIDHLYQDDLWRRNYDAIKALQLHATDFDPHYPTSIGYYPLPRPALEAFLAQRGLFHKGPKWNDFFHHGFLNKLYLRLNEVVFRGSSKVREKGNEFDQHP